MWLPGKVRTEIERDRAEFAMQLVEVEGMLAYYNRELKQIDPHLSLMLAKPDTDHPALKPGYFHLVRQNPGHLADVEVFQHPDGTYRDPDSSLFDFVAKSDLWNDRAQRALRDTQRKAREAARRQQAREAQARAADFDDRLNHALGTQIHVKS